MPTGSRRVEPRRLVWLAAGLALAGPAGAEDDPAALEAQARPCEALHRLRQSGTAGREADLERLRAACLGESRAEWVGVPDDATRQILRTEVSVRQHRACLRAGACDPDHLLEHLLEPDCNHGAAGRDNHPANCVDWTGAAEYCAWLGGRLPSAAEFAAAAGLQPERPYPWGWMTPTCQRASFRNRGSYGCGLGSTAPVDERPDGAGPTGAQDLVGNVWEWTSDAGSEGGAQLVVGGSWEDGMALLRADQSQSREASTRHGAVGFRCVRDGLADASRPGRADWADDVRRRSVLVPAGPFARGSPRGVGDDDEFPAATLDLSAFRIGQSEVSVSEYRACVLEGGCRTRAFRTAVDEPGCSYGADGRSNHPMNCVSWFGAQEYCHWAGGRLPTEAEWEKAARGVDGREFPWGNDVPHCGWANFNEYGNAAAVGCGTGGTYPLGAYPTGVSPYGALDLAGNLQEWVSDWYGDTYYQLAPDHDPSGPLTGSARVVRGGSYNDPAPYIRAAYRYFYEPTEMPPLVGFRCAFTAEE